MNEIKKANPQSIEDIKMLINKHQLGVDSKSEARNLLIEGLNNIKFRIEYNEKLKEAGNISLDVEKMGGWVHNLVRDTLGGTINSTKQTISWKINNRTIEYNPYNGNVEYAD